MPALPAFERVLIEASSAAEALIDVRLTERLVGLETADIDVPSPPGASEPVPLYFRLTTVSPTAIVVELWQLGQSFGARAVVVTGTGNLRARRIALAAAELARRLRRQRLAELAARRRPADDGASLSDAAQGLPIYARFFVAGGARADLFERGAFALGPNLDTELRFSTGQRVVLGAAWLAGNLPRIDADLRILSVHLGVHQAFALSKATHVVLGADASVGSLGIQSDADASVAVASSGASGSFAAPAGAATPPGRVDSWTSDVSARARLEWTLGRHLSLSVGPDLGVILHPVDAANAAGQTTRFGGGFLGVQTALVVGW